MIPKGLAVPETNDDFRSRKGAILNRVTLFAWSALFAVSGQFIVAGAMSLARRSGLVDFKAADPNETAAFNILAGVFVVQVAFILIGLAKSGPTLRRFIIGGAALIMAFSFLMMLFVALQCDLYGACL